MALDHKKEQSLNAFKLKLSIIFLFASIAIICSCTLQKNQNGNQDKLYGGYTIYGYNTKSDIENKANISGKVIDGKTKKKIENAEVAFYNSDGEIIYLTTTDHKGNFNALVDKHIKFGHIEIEKDLSFITISNIDYGALYHNIKITANLLNYDYSISEETFDKKTKDILDKELKRKLKDE